MLSKPCVLRVGKHAILVIHVDDVLFPGDENWLRTEFIPKLQSDFKLTSTIVPRQDGGPFEFLKRYREISPGYNTLIVYPESKHVISLFDRYTAAHGKPPKMFKTPCVSSAGYSPDDGQTFYPPSTDLLSE